MLRGGCSIIFFFFFSTVILFPVTEHLGSQGFQGKEKALEPRGLLHCASDNFIVIVGGKGLGCRWQRVEVGCGGREKGATVGVRERNKEKGSSVDMSTVNPLEPLKNKQ